ncbi:Acyl-CoA dehydrogenase family member 11 [Hondaea fermentalgiana]|uniref:Acyl-CoA dehydrogenase family member 11 n=1 Tax=Hondaea fermentalgiana TaxID=2315210 RepID=A0A2R5GZK6_9STRA|nr:Acyl-CoA dehydrogenase family member 11 [Hondaea fermentalgiana]|eukprot:GBG34203.1 Acyl-CoA dehydrogenase family member 11 [Hondaea fermentalgiana]
MQVHGAMGLSQDTFLPSAFLWARGLRLADGPDEVHWRTVGRLELRDQKRRDDSLYDLPGYTRRGAPHSKNPPTDPDFLAKL